MMIESPIDWTTWEGGMHATIMFIIRDGQILLIEKKRGLGAGKINGPGGKIDPGETPEQPREVELVIGQLQLLEGRDMALVSAEELLAGSIWSAKLQQQLFNLRDEDLEFQVNGRRSFEEFFGLGVMNSIPDAKTVAFFRESLRKAEVI